MKKYRYQMPTVRYQFLAMILVVGLIAGIAFAQGMPEATEMVVGTAERISLDLKGVDIVELFKILSMKTGLTIVPSKGVRGRVTLFLTNVTFEDALEVILVSQGLACERRDDIIHIMTAAEYEQLYGQRYNEKRRVSSFKLTYAKPKDVFAALGELKSTIGKVIVDESSGTVVLIDIPEKLALMEETVRDLDRPPQTELFDLSYAKAEDLKAQLAEALTTGPGQMVVDKRTNKVIVSDLPEKMKKIKQMVRAFDEEDTEVLIEAKIVQLALSDKFERGVNWEAIFYDLAHSDFVGKFPVSPALSAYKQISVGTLDKDDFNLVLQFLQTIGETNILSRPSIAVVNNEEAKILVGAREAYVTQTISQAEVTTTTTEAVEYIDVGVKLNVVPTIHKDGFVTMRIKPEVSSVRETLVTALGSKIPIVETSEAETVVKIKDGAMIMIAGLIKEEKRDDRQGVPFLSRIPVLGALFGNRTKLAKKTELIVFITPHIITGDVEVKELPPVKEVPPEEAVLKKEPKGMKE